MAGETMSACQHCGAEHPPGSATCPTSGDSLTQPGVVGQRVDRYQVERLLGTGGFGAVYRARHVHTDAVVALKLLKRSLGADQAMLERFLREAKAAASVGSEHIVRVLDAGLSAEGQAFLALEFLEGLDLKELSARQGPLAPVRLGLLAVQVLEGLGAAHARGIVHRDMKPANVFVVRRSDAASVERDFVKLLDFGISKMHAEDGTAGLTMTGVAMGTPAYMAPEQFFDARSVDQRADLYSVSAMLYELLSGRLPFDAESYAHLIVKVRTEQPPLLAEVAPHVPTALAQVVTVGLAREPHQRWQTAAEMAQALRSALAELQASGRGATPHRLPMATPQPMPAGLEATHTPAKQPAPLPPQAPVPPPSSAGWVAPAGAPTPSAPAPAPPRPVAPPPAGKPSSGLKWVAILLGLVFLGGGCCTCAAVLGASAEAQGVVDPAE
jgi:serine/threonine-protein kinase